MNEKRDVFRDFDWFFAAVNAGRPFNLSRVYRTRGGRFHFRVYLVDDTGIPQNCAFALREICGMRFDVERDAVICPHTFVSYGEALMKQIRVGLAQYFPDDITTVEDRIHIKQYHNKNNGDRPVQVTSDPLMCFGGTIYYREME